MRSDYFFVRPSFLRGAARVVDFWGSLGAYDTKLSGNAADAAALESDWGMVGRDLNSGIDKYRESLDERQMSLFDGEGEGGSDRDRTAPPPPRTLDTKHDPA